MALFLIHGIAVTATGVKSISFTIGCQIRLGFSNICWRKITGTRRKTAFWGKGKKCDYTQTLRNGHGGRIPIFQIRGFIN